MSQSGFQFKRFYLSHDKCAMKVGTDSIILGSWTSVEKAKRVLDIGTGSGLLAIMMAQKSDETAQIDAIEIDNEAAKQAETNIAQSPWPQRIRVFNTAAQDFVTAHPYDLIISNPPYYVGKQGELTPTDAQFISPQRRLARHTLGLSFEALASSVDRLLSADGQANLVLPELSADEFIQLATDFELFPIRQLSIQSGKLKPPTRRLICFARGKQNCISECLCIHAENGQYSQKFRTLCKDFYLKF